jgi:DNA-binding PadR family transcriptional regulator
MTQRRGDLSLTEWAVLAIAAEHPTHGFAIAKELAPGGDLGRIWTVSRPLVYRALTSLARRGLIEPLGEEASGRGPNRTPVRATRAGRAALGRWLTTPSPHIRDLRTRMLLQIRILDRRHADIRPIVSAQLEELYPIVTNLGRMRRATTGFDRVLATWRYESAKAAVRWLASLKASAS